MEILVGFGVMLCIYIIWREQAHSKEREKLINKLLAKNFVEYTNCEISKESAKTKPRKESPKPQKFAI